MIEQTPGSMSPNPSMCLWRGPSFDGIHSVCALASAWGNCLSVGCYIRPDGSTCEFDNSPEACERRLRAMKEEK